MTAVPLRVKDAAQHMPFPRGVLAVPQDNQQDARNCHSAAQAKPPDSTCVVVALPAEIDIANASRVQAELLTAIGAGTVIIADLSRCSFCDCAGAEALFVVSAEAKARGGQLRIVAAAGPVLRVLDLIGLTQVVPVYPTKSAAVRGGPVPANTVPANTVPANTVPATTVVTPLRRILDRRPPLTRRPQADAAESVPQPDPPRSP
jgi:anti-sigma B factor antagonist